MSNTLTIKSTMFKNRDDDEPTYGFRIYDNYAKTYCNDYDHFLTDEEAIKEAFEFITASDSEDLDFDFGLGAEVNGTWFEPVLIQDIIDRD